MTKDFKELLKSEDTEVRRQAIESLRTSDNDSSVSILLDAMKDESWRVRKTATEILQNQFQIQQYINGLISLLYIDDNAGARNSAIDLLISLDKTAIPYLIDAFNSDNRDVRKFIIDVIGEISDKRALPLLLNALKDEDENVKASAVEHLGTLKEPSVVDALIDILNGDDLWIAYPAADALGRICDRRAIPHLVNALDRKTMREPVLRALASFSHPDTLDSIIPLLAEGTRSVKEEVLRTISKHYTNGVSEEIIAGKIKEFLGDDSFEILLKFAWSNKTDIRISAILLLGILKDVRVVQPLLEMSVEEDFRDDIKRALVFIGRERPEYIIQLFDNLSILQKRFITEVAVEIRNPVFSELFEKFLQDDDGHVRALAAKGLAGLGDGRVIEKLFVLLDDPYIDVQEATVEALVKLKNHLAMERLIEGLRHNSRNLRRNSALILGKIGAVESIPSIGFVVKDPDVSVRKAAVYALSMMNSSKTVKHLVIALTDEEPEIRIAAAYALGGIRSNKATDALILLLNDADESVRVAAAKALAGTVDIRAFEALCKALSDKNGFVVTAAIETLGKMKTETARDAILEMLSSDDVEIKRTAINSLGDFTGMQEKIKHFLVDPDWATRKIAVEALGKQADVSVVGLLEEVYDDETDLTVKKTIEEVLRVIK